MNPRGLKYKSSVTSLGAGDYCSRIRRMYRRHSGHNARRITLRALHGRAPAETARGACEVGCRLRHVIAGGCWSPRSRPGTSGWPQARGVWDGGRGEVRVLQGVARGGGGGFHGGVVDRGTACLRRGLAREDPWEGLS